MNIILGYSVLIIWFKAWLIKADINQLEREEKEAVREKKAYVLLHIISAFFIFIAWINAKFIGV